MTTATITKTTFTTCIISGIVKTRPTLNGYLCSRLYYVEIRISDSETVHTMPSPQTYQLRMPVKTSEESVEEEN